MATVFISSRMGEFELARAEAFEAVHFAGHTPLILEQVRGIIGERKEGVKAEIDRMLEEAQGFVGIYGLSAGDASKLYDDKTPIQYELDAFCSKHETDSRAKIWLYVNEHAASYTKDPEVTRFIEKCRSRGFSLTHFRQASDLKRFIGDSLRTGVLADQRDPTDAQTPAQELCVMLRCADREGLIRDIAHELYRKFYNIDYISHACRHNHATVIVACSPRNHVADINRAGRELRDALNRRFAGEVAPIVAEPPIVVDAPEPSSDEVCAYSAQVRNLDTPGVLYRICSKVAELRVNIDLIRLTPFDRLHPHGRQAVAHMDLTIHKSKIRPGYTPTTFPLCIESDLRSVLGVVAASVRLVFEGAAWKLYQCHRVC